MEKMKILVLDDEPGYRIELSEYLTGKGFDVLTAGLPSEALQMFEREHIDIAIVDIRLPETSGLNVLNRIRKIAPSTEVIMITGHGDMETVLEAFRNGAAGFFNKPFVLSDVLDVIRKSEKYLKVSKQYDEQPGISGEAVFQDVASEAGMKMALASPAMKRLMDTVSKVAGSADTTVLITGESGSGKELIARAIHHLSDRREHSFFPVNCSAIPPDLFESEFFGHKKGSFTGAVSESQGWFNAAHKGTLFLDEISEMKTDLQAKFLRVMEDKKVSMIGSRKEIDIDVRIVAATNRNLADMVREGRFREDLLYRLQSFVIDIPPLRNRKEEIPVLFNFFVQGFAGKLGKKIVCIEKGIQEALMNYDFPGNVRELKNMVERAVIMCEGERLWLHDFPALELAGKRVDPADNIADCCGYDLNQLEQNYIRLALEKTANNKTQAAKLLHISRQALERKMKKHGIQ